MKPGPTVDLPSLPATTQQKGARHNQHRPSFEARFEQILAKVGLGSDRAANEAAVRATRAASRVDPSEPSHGGDADAGAAPPPVSFEAERAEGASGLLVEAAGRVVAQSANLLAERAGNVLATRAENDLPGRAAVGLGSAMLEHPHNVQRWVDPGAVEAARSREPVRPATGPTSPAAADVAPRIGKQTSAIFEATFVENVPPTASMPSDRRVIGLRSEIPLPRAQILSVATEKHFQPVIPQPVSENPGGRASRSAADESPGSSPNQFRQDRSEPRTPPVERASAMPVADPERPHRPIGDPIPSPIRRDERQSRFASAEDGKSGASNRASPQPAPAAPARTDGASQPTPTLGYLSQQLGAAVLQNFPGEGPAVSPGRRLLPSEQGIATGPTRVIHVALEPAELGRVTVRMRNTGHSLAVHVVAERAETSALLERERHLLSGLLGSGGKFEDVAIQVSGPQSPASTAAPAPAGDQRHGEALLPQSHSGQGEGSGRHQSARSKDDAPASGGSEANATPSDIADGAGLYV